MLKTKKGGARRPPGARASGKSLGRPRLADGRRMLMQFRVSEREEAAYQFAAQASGMTLQDWARKILDAAARVPAPAAEETPEKNC